MAKSLAFAVELIGDLLNGLGLSSPHEIAFGFKLGLGYISLHTERTYTHNT